VVDKHGETIASAVTNLDLHDIARAAKTYGVRGYYVITPIEEQLALVRQILDHWIIGKGAVYNPKRRQALELVRVNTSFEAMRAEITAEEGCPPRTVATSARRHSGSLSYRRLREMLNHQAPVILAFGTAWGLSDDFMADADDILDPLAGAGTYNHLSVRTAVAIILDRLLGDENEVQRI